MGKEYEQSDAPPTEDEAFDALLKHAAHVTRPVPTSRLAPDESLVSGRLKITRRLGAGGMGVVFEAYDLGRQAPVALKTLHRLSPVDVYRLKNEFRALVDVVHPNLCRLYELFCEGQDWLFTMELVDGVPFDAWVRPHGELDEVRLRLALPQLHAAIAALHQSGKLHRDLKPSNVLVTKAGRVVVLDFGLVVDPESGGAGLTLPDFSVSGTPGYMSPEQAAGTRATAASDRYALGVMLFEALTGRLPFTGNSFELLAAKRAAPAPEARAFQPSVPEDLNALCAALLVREPVQRMDESALRAWFAPRPPAAGGGVGATRPARRPAVMIDLAQIQDRVATLPQSEALARSGDGMAQPFADAAPDLLGRDLELAQLRAAFHAACTAGKPVIVLVAGESGIGKSALCAAFVAGLRAQQSAVVFSGCCYERERVPFKAFDVVVDALSRHLRKLADEARSLMPDDVAALQRIFPVLGRITAVGSAPSRNVPDAQVLRARGFAAFAQLMARMRARQPLVVHLDDLQWSDADSTLLLMHLLAAPEAPPILWILSHRSEHVLDHPYLAPLYGTLPGLDLRRMLLGPLAPAAAKRLLGAPLSGCDAHVAGNPFLLGELRRHAALRTRMSSELSVRAMLAARAAALPGPERRLMEIVAVASRPIDLELAMEAAGIRAAPRTLFEALRDKNLARATGDGTRMRLDCFHAEVRESLLRGLSQERLWECHAALAAALGARADAGAEQLAVHLLGAGRLQEAALHLLRAADAALGALSFDRAAHLYAQALEHGRFEASEAQRVQQALDQAHASAQRSV